MIPFVWIDCEMTGLDYERDQLLEVACVITNETLDVIEEGPQVIIHHPAEVLDRMVPVVQKMHSSSGLNTLVLESTTTYQEGQEQLVQFLKRHMGLQEGRLCGNTIWNDRNFLYRFMPAVLTYTHYRMIDVSSIKELVQEWYPFDEHIYFEKSKSHRALTDVYESIAELRHYKKYFFV